jgi:hypothetical protein
MEHRAAIIENDLGVPQYPGARHRSALFHGTRFLLGDRRIWVPIAAKDFESANAAAPGGLIPGNHEASFQAAIAI